jgi:DNA polymerase III subunit beta
MQITVNRNELAAAFAWAYKGVTKRPVVPVLRGVLVEVKGALSLSAFDYETAHRAYASNSGPPDDVSDGRILVDARDLKSVMGVLPKGKNVQVTLWSDGSVLDLVSGADRLSVSPLPPEEYPDLPPLPPLAGTVNGAEFAKSVLRTAEAAGRDDTLPSLTCIALKPRNGTLRMEATDRYRLAIDEVPWSRWWAGGVKLPEVILVPAGLHGGYYPSGLAQFAKGAAKSERVQVHYGLGELGAWAGFADNWHELIIRPNPGEFPKVTEKLARQESPVTLTGDAKALSQAVRSAGATTTKNLPVVLRYAPGAWRGSKGDLEITGQGDSGQVTSTRHVAANADYLEGFTVGFNPEYLASMLDGFTGEVLIGLAGEHGNPRPAVIRSADAADPFTAVVVPQRPPDESKSYYSKAA